MKVMPCFNLINAQLAGKKKKDSADDRLKGFFYYYNYVSQKLGFDFSCKLTFFQKTGFAISCKLSPKETICMKMSKPIFWEH